MLDTRIHVEFIYCCQQPIQPMIVGYFLSIPPRMESLFQMLSLQPLLKQTSLTSWHFLQDVRCVRSSAS